MNPSSLSTEARKASCPLCMRTRLRRLYSRAYQGRTWHLANCLDCGVHFTDPPPGPSDLDQFYAGDYHKELRLEGASEIQLGPKFKRYTELIRSVAPPGRSLDVGCATGLFPRMLRDYGYDAEGIEMHSQTARWGSEHYGIPIRVATLETLQFSEEQSRYDLVTLTDVLEHTINPLKGLGIVHKLLKPGGHALVTFPDIWSVKSRTYLLLSRLTKRGWLTCHVPHHTWEFTYHTAVSCFARAGFAVVAFQRSEGSENFRERHLRILLFPMRLLSLKPIASRLGTQMEFVLVKLQKDAPEVGELPKPRMSALTSGDKEGQR